MDLLPAFKVDENLPVEVAEYLRQAGYNAITVHEEGIGGTSDAVLAEICRSEQRVLLTLDTDFSDIRAYPPERFSGFVILRLRRQDKPNVLNVIARLVPFFQTEPIVGRLWIVEEERFRIRTGG